MHYCYQACTTTTQIYFPLEPFSKNEAWKWLQAQITSDNTLKVWTSIRTLAHLWKWHKSKVERFIKDLRNKDLIETEIKSGRTVIALAKETVSKDDISSCETQTRQTSLFIDNSRSSKSNISATDNNRDSFNATHKTEETLTDRVIDKQHYTEAETLSRQNRDSYISATDTNNQDSRDSFKAEDKTEKILTDRVVDKCHDPEAETTSRQNRDSLVIFENVDEDFKKKEKNQKKEKLSSCIKEKNTPYGSTKKERWVDFPANPLATAKVMASNEPCSNLLHTNQSSTAFDQTTIESVACFAKQIGFDTHLLSWEFEKFKDYWISTGRTYPKNEIAAFRNWLRKSIEFTKGVNHARPRAFEASNKNTERKTSFERFLAGSARAVAEFERNRLDRSVAWKEPLSHSKDSVDSERFKDLLAVN